MRPSEAELPSVANDEEEAAVLVELNVALVVWV